LQVVADFRPNVAFLEKEPLWKDFQNFLPKGFTTSEIPVLFANFVKFGRSEIGKVVRYLLDKKKTKFCLTLSLSILCGSLPKSANASGKQCSQSAPNLIQIVSLLAFEL